jgi:hypothetical protein
MADEVLQGGVANAGAVGAAARHVLRPSNRHTESIHRFLRALRDVGFEGRRCRPGSIRMAARRPLTEPADRIGGLDRRRFLALSGAGLVTTALAGCAGNEPPATGSSMVSDGRSPGGGRVILRHR